MKMRLTREELTDHIKEQVVPEIKEFCDKNVAELVRENIEKAVAPIRERTEALTTQAFSQSSSSKQRTREKGDALGRCIRATAWAKLNDAGVDGAIAQLKRWGDDDLADKWQEARTKALSAGDAASGGFLVPEEFSSELIELLRARSVVRAMGATTISISGSGTLNIPKLTSGAAAAYIGENTNIGKSEQVFGNLKLSFKKLAVLTPISNDLIRYSSPGADQVVRTDLVEAMRVKEDQKFIRGDGTDGAPRGLLSWCPGGNKIAADGTVSLVNTFQDLGKLVLKLQEGNTPMTSPGWLFAPRTQQMLMTALNANGVPAFRDEMSNGQLWGFPFASTTSIPITLDTTGAGTNDESEIYFCDFSQAVIGESSTLQISASDTAAYHDGSNVIAAYSQDQTVIRAISEHDFGMRHDAAVAILTGVDWAPGAF
jgi:HK97 family phage major capsid protein